MARGTASAYCHVRQSALNVEHRIRTLFLRLSLYLLRHDDMMMMASIITPHDNDGLPSPPAALYFARTQARPRRHLAADAEGNTRPLDRTICSRGEHAGQRLPAEDARG